MCAPWQGAQCCANMSAPFLICSGGNCSGLCAATPAPKSASRQATTVMRFISPYALRLEGVYQASLRGATRRSHLKQVHGNHAMAALLPSPLMTRENVLNTLLFGHQRKSPHRSPARDVLELLAHPGHIHPADAGENRDILSTLLRKRDRLCVDARARLELPQCLARVDVEPDELAGLFAGE